MNGSSLVDVAVSRSVHTRWRWAQAWRELLFAHWRVPEAALRRHLPDAVSIDTWRGDAWVSAVAFRLNTRPIGCPSVPFVSSFLELNLRTYVRDGDTPAVWFLSMHGSSRLAVWLGRRLTPLPYSFIPIRMRRIGEQCSFSCGEPHRPLFATEYRAFGETGGAIEGTLDAWLIKRYSAIVQNRVDEMLHTRVEHPAWQIQSATARIDAGRLGSPWKLDLARPPDMVQFAKGVRARVSAFETI